MLKKLILAASALLVSAPVLADPPHWAPAHGWRAKQPHYRPYHPYARAVVVMPAPRVYYRPAPAYYYPAPVYRPAPVEPSISIGVTLPL